MGLVFVVSFLGFTVQGAPDETQILQYRFPQLVSQSTGPAHFCSFVRKVARGRPSASERAAADLADKDSGVPETGYQ